MPETSVRFAVINDAGKRAATWKCWSPSGVGKHDVYLACRELGGFLKASLHQSNQWHIAYRSGFLEANLPDPVIDPPNRFIDKWQRPKEIAPGITLAFRIVTPFSAATTPITKPESQKIKWIPNAPIGKATEIDVLITKSNTVISSWPGKRSMGTKLVGSMPLESGETVWIVYWYVPLPQTAKLSGTPTFFKGKSRLDLSGNNLRILLFGQEPDGSRVVFDCVAQLKEDSA